MVILASASPRRRELLRRLVRDFDVVPADVDETLDGPPTPAAIEEVALRKARAVAARAGRGIVVAADTVVVLDGEALGKPSDAAHARAMLRRLRGRRHQVVTGVAVVDAATGRERSTAVVSEVTMAPCDDATIDRYVAGGEPLDKAGAYAIQGAGRRLVAAWSGSFSNIVGLPVDETRRLLAAFGVPVSEAPADPAP